MKASIPTILSVLLSTVPTSLSYHNSPSAAATPTANLDTLFQYTTSRNHRVISQAVDFVVSMQTAPTCTRMAASHLMNECKLLENAPDFAKGRPEAYLDNVKTEYAAKLAVCELLSAQPPSSAVPPLHCDILAPSSKACGKGGWWHHTQPDTDRQCYPGYKEYQYSQCLKTLQSSPQYWTSFSNARQNAVVMCQASRDAIERENHLETFKNLTQIMGAVSSNIEKTSEDYQLLIKEQKEFTDELRATQTQLKHDVQKVQEKALSTVTILDDKFHAFMDTSIAELITALADNQSAEIVRIHEEMQAFSRAMIAEGSKLSTFFTAELQQHHEQAMTSIQIHHEAQLGTYRELSHYMNDISDTAIKINTTTNSSLAKIGSIEQRLESLSDKAETIAKGFAFFSMLPELIASLVRGIVAISGILSMLALLYNFNKQLAVCAAGASSSAYLLHICGVYKLIMHLSTLNVDSQRPLSPLTYITDMSVSQKGAGLVIIIWLSTYPVSRANAAISTAISRVLASYYIVQYSNDGGTGFLPCVEVPVMPPRPKIESFGSFFPHSDDYTYDEGF